MGSFDMGYSTYYTLTRYDGKDFTEEQLASIKEIGEFEDVAAQMCEGHARWYDWREDMLKLSLKHTDTLFLLHGEGEESGDLWDAYFGRGKVQVCAAEIVYPEFDERKMA
jgi:hypothetical protein